MAFLTQLGGRVNLNVFLTDGIEPGDLLTGNSIRVNSMAGFAGNPDPICFQDEIISNCNSDFFIGGEFT